MSSLFEKHRPTTLDGIVGQDEALAQVSALVARSWGGRAYWITGPSGTGKTTLARALALLGADPIAIEEIDAQRLTPAAVRAYVETYSTRSLFGKGGKAFVVNEAHGLRKDALRELLTAIEPSGGLPAHIVWIFTTTKTGEAKLFDDDESGDAAPLLSRCAEIELTANDATQSAFARRLAEIAQAEALPSAPPAVWERLVGDCRGNMRRALQRLESGAYRMDAIAVLEREYGMVKATKGDYGEKRRQEISEAIQALKAR